MRARGNEKLKQTTTTEVLNMYRYLFLLSYFLTLPVFAIYDLVAVNITPSKEKGTTFGFQMDTPQTEMYLALYIEGVGFQSILRTETGELQFAPLQDLKPFLPKGKAIPVGPFGPFTDDTLRSVKLYAGTKAATDETTIQKEYTQIFKGIPTLTKEEKPWTVMVYMVGSTLEKKAQDTFANASKDLLEMLAGSRSITPNPINVVVTTGGSSRFGWTTVKRSLIRDGQLYILEDLGPQPLSDPQTLSDFVLWAKDQFPAQHYALVLWNHGGGTQGIGQDTALQQNAKMMSLGQLHEAYQTIRENLSQPLEMVLYDACLMSSIEVAEVTATVAKVMTASAEIEPPHGLNYEHLLSSLGETLPTDGIAVGKIVKDGYLQQSKDQGTFNNKQITYSVFDLSQLPAFTATFQQFATEFSNFITQESAYRGSEVLSHGIIRAPGYPRQDAGRLDRSLDTKQNVRIDLYNVLQTALPELVIPEFPQLKAYAEDLVNNKLPQLVVDYEANDNVIMLNPQAGRVSLDIGNDKSYLPVLPTAYTAFHDALDAYNNWRKNHPGTPESNGTECYSGMTCADAHWLKLPKSDLLGIDGYYGQQLGDVADLYLIQTLLQYPNFPENPNIGAKGEEACQYQLCVNDAQCENITVKKQSLAASRYELVADVTVNDSPAILSFCGSEDTWQTDTTWPVCSMVAQTNGIWGRDEGLYPEEVIIPKTLHLLPGTNELQIQAENALVVEIDAPVLLKRSCDESKAAIVAGYYGLNNQRRFDTLCNNQGLANCFCQQPVDFLEAPEGDEGCKTLNVKSGIYLQE
jgi:hypothetical protein